MTDIDKISEEVTDVEKEKEEAQEEEVLKRVSDSMEMAGEAMDFFEESGEEVQEKSGTDKKEVEFIDENQVLCILESLLFSSDRPLGIGTMKTVFNGTNIKTKEIKKYLEVLQGEYADERRGVTLEEINGGWQLRTKIDSMPYLRKLAKARPFKLSGPALEVLSIIAYKQPIVKNEVDQIRGVESGHLVRALMEKHLVCFQGKSELPGKPMQYGTTRKFLEIFGLRNLKELPSLDEIDQLLPDGIGMDEKEEVLADVTDSMAEQFEGNYSEAEDELEKITEKLGGIDTSSEFFEEEKRRQREKRDRDRAQDLREALTVGEEISTKDQRWLDKYDEKMKAEQEAQEPVVEAAGEVEMTEPTSEEESTLNASPIEDDEFFDSETETENEN